MNYLSGFGNEFLTEVEPGVVPNMGANPKKCFKGLYAEQISGSAFTAESHANLRSYTYRKIPSAKHEAMKPFSHNSRLPVKDSIKSNPNRMRWMPFGVPKSKTKFFNGLYNYSATNLSSHSGCAVYGYAFNESMNKGEKVAFKNCDGEMLFVPQSGELSVRTELGDLQVKPGEIFVIPRGIVFQVNQVSDAVCKGYICENYGSPFVIPHKGLIGPNSLAGPRDFLYPVAALEDDAIYTIVTKYENAFWSHTQEHTPFNVMGWFGNYAPYKYDLARYCTINTVSYDHPDPSIFTVLSSPSTEPGVANIDFVIFPPRWMVAENTFRPPYFHRNIMSEFMGLIRGVYDAKPSDSGFVPGGASLHNCMSAHGPDAQAVKHGESCAEKPLKISDALAFMFETRQVQGVHKDALNSTEFDSHYDKCWQGLQSRN